MNEKLKKIFDVKIRPYLARHNGDMEIVEFSDGVLRVKFLGQCGNCISAKYTLHDIVESAVREIPEIKSVELVDSLNQDTLNFAKKILDGKV
jgi:Fe-S cluster biogenesis protein NfuA